MRRPYHLPRGTASLQFGFDLGEDAFGRYQFSAAGFDIAQSTLDFLLPRRAQLAVRAVLQAIEDLAGDRGPLRRVKLERGFQDLPWLRHASSLACDRRSVGAFLICAPYSERSGE